MPPGAPSLANAGRRVSSLIQSISPPKIPLSTFVVIRGLPENKGRGSQLNGHVGVVSNWNGEYYTVSLADGRAANVRDTDLDRMPVGSCEGDTRYYSYLPPLTLEIVHYMCLGQASALRRLVKPAVFDPTFSFHGPQPTLPIDALDRCITRFLSSHARMHHSCRAIDSSPHDSPSVIFDELTGILREPLAARLRLELVGAQMLHFPNGDAACPAEHMPLWRSRHDVCLIAQVEGTRVVEFEPAAGVFHAPPSPEERARLRQLAGGCHGLQGLESLGDGTGPRVKLERGGICLFGRALNSVACMGLPHMTSDGSPEALRSCTSRSIVLFCARLDGHDDEGGDTERQRRDGEESGEEQVLSLPGDGRN